MTTSTSTKRWLMVVACATTVGLAGCSGGGGAGAKTPRPTTSSTTTTPPLPRLVIAAEGCSATANIADSGQSISFDTAGNDDSDGDSYDTVVCLLGRTSVPDFVTQHMESTRALDGQQTDQWNGYTARWSYHPDSGLRITIVDQQFKAATS